MKPERTRIVILGAGIAGVTTAYCLARDGHHVTVIERGAEAATETSHANGGVVGASQVEPWASPGLPRKILGWIGREDAPVLLRLRELPRLLGWGTRFVRSCTEAQFRRGIAVNSRLTAYSLAMFAEIRRETGIGPADYDLGHHGALELYFTPQSLARGRDLAQVAADQGLAATAIGPDEAIAREPALARATERVAGAVLFGGDEIGDCAKFARALAARCRDLGVTFRFETPILGLRTEAGRVTAAETAAGPVAGDAFVAALASYTPSMLRTFGVRVPVIPVKGVTITVPAAPWPDAVRGALMDHVRLYGLIRIGDRLRIAGSAEVTGFQTAAAPARCDAMVRNVLSLLPDFARCLDGVQQFRWGCLRACTPDGPPVLGETPVPNLFLNTGHGPEGWSTSCGTARVVADIVGGRKPAIDLDGLTLARFG